MSKDTLKQISDLHGVVLRMDQQYLGFFKAMNLRMNLITDAMKAGRPDLIGDEDFREQLSSMIAAHETGHEHLEASLRGISNIVEAMPDDRDCIPPDDETNR